MRAPSKSAPARLPLPREHGAWGLLFQPLIASLSLTAAWTWAHVPVLSLLVCAFLVREPLVIWIRHRLLWQRDSAEAAAAGRWAMFLLTAVAVSAGALTLALPAIILAPMLGGGLILSAASVGLTLRNQQRSVLLQAVSATGLTSTPLLVAAAATGTLPDWAWLLWVTLAAHAVAAIPVVHARLQFRAHKPSANRLAALSAALQLLQLVAALVLLFGANRLWIPFALSAFGNGFELLRGRSAAHRGEPLTRVGIRLLLVSLLHTTAAVVVLH